MYNKEQQKVIDETILRLAGYGLTPEDLIKVWKVDQQIITYEKQVQELTNNVNELKEAIIEINGETDLINSLKETGVV